jgi:iron complex transport system ATP-binding protein
LKTIAGIIPPISGTVLIDGKNLQQIEVKARVSLVSMVLTERIRLNGIHVRQLVGMGCTAGSGHFSFFKKDDQKAIASALQAMNIEYLADKPMSECSDGELQKAMIARALAQGSQLMIMDEPTAFLDYIAKEELFLMLKKLLEESRVSVLFSSHDIALMEKYAGEIIQL